MRLANPASNRAATALLKWSGVDLFVFAKRLLAAGDEQGANDLMKIALSLQEAEDKLAGYADEVKAGQITRGLGVQPTQIL